MLWRGALGLKKLRSTILVIIKETATFQKGSLERLVQNYPSENYSSDPNVLLITSLTNISVSLNDL